VVPHEAVFAEQRARPRPGGLLIFSTFGPDTLKELRAAFVSADAHVHVNTFGDMHDLGDALVGAGFADPVMEMESDHARVRDRRVRSRAT
jgi:malonyl-CoA O-methyltransferase